MSGSTLDDKKREHKRLYMQCRRLLKLSTNGHKTNQTKQFVAIDSEGANTGETWGLERKNFREEGPDVARVDGHRTFLWGAASRESDPVWLGDGLFQNSKTIIEWLLDLPKYFPNSIFIMFAAGYDFNQIFKDVALDKVQLIQARQRRGKGGDRLKSGVYWQNYSINYIKGKMLTLKDLDDGRHITIYDTFGFFQTSFLKAMRGFKGVASVEEDALIEEGKTKREGFDCTQIDFAKHYQLAELRVLCRMMDQLRQSFQNANLKVRHFWGAGSVAKSMLKLHKISDAMMEVKEKNIEQWQDWAHHAFAGGRIELIKQGTTTRPLYEYDLRSAYPAAMVELPSMRGGEWIFHSSDPGLDALKQMSPLTMVRLHAEDTEGHATLFDWMSAQLTGDEIPFYPFFYREQSGAIKFPPKVYGTYMLCEVLAAYKWRDEIGNSSKRQLKNDTITYRNDPRITFRIEIESVLEFKIGTIQQLPFSWVSDYYRLRAEYKARGDITEKALKLGLNALYGKLAQAIGANPGFANPVYAAYITARTRSRLLLAALAHPRKVVSFMTDAIISEVPLDLDCTNELGFWEKEEYQGGIFVHSGVYDFGGGKKVKTRGIRPQLVDVSETGLWKEIKEAWRTGARSVVYKYKYYMTIGLSSIDKAHWKNQGCWVDSTRELQCGSVGAKRRLLESGHKRAKQLCRTLPAAAYSQTRKFGEMWYNLPLSARSEPDWLNDADERDDAFEREQLEILER